MQGIIDDFERLRPALEKLAKDGDAVPLDRVRLRPPLPRPGKILACIANYWEHAQREARPLNMFMKNPDAVIGPRRHHHAAGIHRAVDVHARGRTRAGDQGAGQDGEGQGLEERRVRLHRDDRRLGARARPPHLAGDAAHQLARQIVRYLRADRPLHRHRRRNRRPERSDRAVLERRPAAPQLQHRRHGASRSGAGRVRHHGHDHEFRRPDRLRHQPRGPRRAAGWRDRRDRNSEHRQDDAEGVRSAQAHMGARRLYGRGFDQSRRGQAPPARNRARSEIRDGMQIDWDVPIAMDDGVVLRADVFRPVGGGTISGHSELRPLRQGAVVPGRLQEPIGRA